MGMLCYSYWAATCPKHFGKQSLFKQDSNEQLRSIKHQARLNLCYQMSFICNFITVSVYWPTIHHHMIGMFQGMDKGYPWIRLHIYWVHSMILPACLINMYCTNAVLRFSTWKVIAFWTVIFTIMFGAFTLGTGQVLYWFLSFQDATTFIVIGMLLLCAIGVQKIASKVDQHFKPQITSQIQKYEC